MPDSGNGPRELRELLVKVGKIETIVEGMEARQRRMEDMYVTKEQFEAIVTPLQRILYGAIAVIVMAVLTALVGLVVNAGAIP